ncbi:MAG TPA: cytochrome c [Bryobacteraceae bacterium]|jgi:mono/diheme cytochrome c family protein|nr:cytochrome c [Bryobacteraceae bacterium]
MRPNLIVLLTLSLIQVQAQTPGAGSSDIQSGKETWQGYFGLENDCKLCHGGQGEGGFAKPLAGHQLTTAQFIDAARKGPGMMPAFVPDKNLNDQQLGQVSAYLASLPKTAQPSTIWQTPIPPVASPAQRLMISTGCGQCHGPIMANPRRTAGGTGADFEWFKREVREHTSAPGHANARHLRMGNYTRRQVSEGTLLEIWRFFAVEQGLRVPINADVSAGVPGENGTTYTINVSNGGLPGRGFTAEYVTITLPLLKGRDPEETTTVVVATTGGGYTGVHRDPISNSQAAEFELARLSPGEKKTYTITLSGKGANAGIPRGIVKWERPLLGSGATDLIGISVPLGN